MNWIKIISLFIFVYLSIYTNDIYAQSIYNNSRLMDSLVNHTINKSLLCLQNAVKEIKDPALYPTYATKELKWKLKSSDDWTSGFYPGCLWYAFALSKDTAFKNRAIEWTAGIGRQKYNTKTHDLGFRFGCSFVKGLTLAPNDTATAKYKEIILTAANTMDKRYSPEIGAYTSDWDFKPLPNSVPVVIDIMMNLEMLLWTTQQGGDTSRIKRCITHTATSYKDLIRKDNSSYHIARYDSVTGKLLNQGQLQGDVDSSTWSRGHAWMIYGLVTMYRFTKDEDYLNKATKVTDYFLGKLPEDRIATWDFQSSIKYRDASASAIVCSALLEMQSYLSGQKRKVYLMEAKKILATLCQSPYFTNGLNTNSLLLHSTQYYHRTDNTDVPAIFADYYFMESLYRYKGIQGEWQKGKRNQKIGIQYKP